MIEHRAIRSEVRAPDETPGTFEAVVLRYGVVDDYNTIFDPGCFTGSLETRMPRITWAHQWSEPIGRWVDYKDTETDLTLVGQLDDMEAVPRARQAYAQLRSGTIDQFSVGFHRIDTQDDENGRTHFQSAGLDEAALVLVGAVPGTKLVSVRSALGDVRQVPEDLVVALGKKIASGEMTHAEASATLNLVAGAVEIIPSAPPQALPEDVTPDADELLDKIGF